MDEPEALRRLGAAPVARMATVDAGGAPHVVPVTFVLAGSTLYWAVDQKPKRSQNVKRLDNIRVNPNVQVLADHYEDDWDELWWVRASGSARIVDDGQERARALTALATKYPRYAGDAPQGPVVAIDLATVTGWSAR